MIHAPLLIEVLYYRYFPSKFPKVFNEKLGTAASHFKYVKPQSEEIFLIGKYFLLYLLKCAYVKNYIFLHED